MCIRDSVKVALATGEAKFTRWRKNPRVGFIGCVTEGCMKLLVRFKKIFDLQQVMSCIKLIVRQKADQMISVFVFWQKGKNDAESVSFKMDRKGGSSVGHGLRCFEEFSPACDIYWSWSDVWNVSYIELRIWNQVSYDHRGYQRNLSNCV